MTNHLVIPHHEPFGTILGYATGGVTIYSSDYSNLHPEEYCDDTVFRNYIGHDYLGHKWQCVEFARRFFYINYGVVFSDVSYAYQIFKLRYVRQVSDDAILPLQAFANGGKRAPEVGSLLIWDEGGEFAVTGHVAVVIAVLPDKIRIAEQNVIHHLLPYGQQWTRELPLVIEQGHYWVKDTFNDTSILGWMIQTEPCEGCLPLPEPIASLRQLHTAYITPNKTLDKPWLNEDNVVEQAYVAAHGHKVNRQKANRYFVMSHSAKEALAQATNELHLMYLQATDYVLKNPDLLRHFNIPQVLWPRVRHSWQYRRHQMISGRMDFCLDERGIKLYEYNADSASCHTEAGLILARWAQQVDLSEGCDPCKNLLPTLSEGWQHSDASSFVHILQDDTDEENYHARFMENALAEAGIATKILTGLNDIHWDAIGRLVDNDQRLIQCVWKTWAWETALEQLRKESEASASLLSIKTGDTQAKVRLIDVLLRPEIKVFEPLWTVIPSNKAILPVLWSLFPNHRYLLETEYQLTPSLQQKGYAVKPIAGRCGDNITLISEDNDLLSETQGQFLSQQQIYQQLWCLPNVDNVYVQACTFSVGGYYAGVCLRSDPSLVIAGDSDIQPLRVLNDQEFKRRYGQ